MVGAIGGQNYGMGVYLGQTLMDNPSQAMMDQSYMFEDDEMPAFLNKQLDSKSLRAQQQLLH
jgi:hypothetical protein